MARTLGIAAALAALLAVAAVSARAGSDERIVVTRDAISLPAGCTTRGLAAFADRFLDAFNSGEWPIVDALFAAGGGRPPDFQLFAWRRDSVRSREDLTAFLAMIRESGERFRLLSVRASEVPNVHASAAIVYVLERPGGLAFGKGLIDCAQQRIWQWAMAPGGDAAATCPLPAGWSAQGPIVACTAGPNAPATSATFVVTGTSLDLPKRCAPSVVRRRVTGALSAFDLGDGSAFAKQFVRNADFHPYTVSRRRGLTGHTRIARFVRSRYAAGDGWTAVRLLPPQGSVGLPSWTVYGLQLAVSHQSAPVAERSGSKLVVDCASGLLRSWVGPALATP